MTSLLKNGPRAPIRSNRPIAHPAKGEPGCGVLKIPVEKNAEENIFKSITHNVILLRNDLFCVGWGVKLYI